MELISFMSELIRGRNPDGKVRDIQIDENKSLKIIICNEDGEAIGGITGLKVVLCGTQSDGTITPLLCDADGQLVTTTGAE